MNFIDIIDIARPELLSCSNLTHLKKSAKMKQLSPFLRGGISKINKTSLPKLQAALSNFNPDDIGALDEYQKTVVTAPISNSRIMAGAGSGKTTTIVYRAKWLMKYMLPTDICILTFNCLSYKNIIDKLTDVFGFAVKVHVFTIDAYARAHLSINNYSVKEYCYLAARLPLAELDMMAREYKYIIFDEFQDVDSDQFSIIKNLSRGAKVMVVGDDAQNIYQFRGSDNWYIDNFDKLVPHVSTYTLLNNYRSSPNIVRAANMCISNSNDIIHKHLSAARVDDVNENIEIKISGVSISDEAQQILSDIKNMTTAGIKYNQICILARNTMPLKEVESILVQNNIPTFTKFGDIDTQENDNITTSITLSTIHRAKGLEWDIVLILGIKDKYFPGNSKNISEERRLFYVAITRARNKVIFYSSNDNCGAFTKIAPVSRFIKEISDAVSTKLISAYYKPQDGNEGIYISLANITNNLSGSNIAYIRQMLNMKPSITTFANPVNYIKSIIDKQLISDYSIFASKYILRRTYTGIIHDIPAELLLSISDPMYSKEFISRLNSAYTQYKLDKSTDIQNIYYVSLCLEIIGRRRRLMYCDISDIFIEQTNIMNDNYNAFLSNAPNIEPYCKKIQYKYDKKILISTIDYVDNNTLVDIKCSPDPMRIEWFINLICSYVMADIKNIDSLAILNILRGEYISISIKNIDCCAIFEYIKTISLNLDLGIRDNKLHLDINNNQGELDRDDANVKIIDWQRGENIHEYVALDVENNTTTGLITDLGVYVSGNKYVWSTKQLMDWRQSQICKKSNAEQLTFDDVMSNLMKILANAPIIVGHNIMTDLYKITNNVMRCAPHWYVHWSHVLSNHTIIDTLSLARSYLNISKYTLSYVYKSVFNEDLVESHDAGADAMASGKIYEHIQSKYKIEIDNEVII